MKEKMSLGEKIFVFSNAGQREIASKDWQGIPVEDRAEGRIIYNELKQNNGVINLEDKKKITLIEESHKAEVEKVENKGISLEDLRDNIGNLSREEINSVLESIDNLKATNQKASREEGFNNLPGDIKATLGISKENLAKLTKDQRTILLKRFDDILIAEKRKKKEEIIESLIA